MCSLYQVLNTVLNANDHVLDRPLISSGYGVLRINSNRVDFSYDSNNCTSEQTDHWVYVGTSIPLSELIRLDVTINLKENNISIRLTKTDMMENTLEVSIIKECKITKLTLTKVNLKYEITSSE